MIYFALLANHLQPHERDEGHMAQLVFPAQLYPFIAHFKFTLGSHGAFPLLQSLQ